MAHELPPLPYPFDALEPHIDSQTMQIHHGKHHQAYVTNLNKALESAPQFAALPVDELLRRVKETPEAVRQAIINNGGGHANHALFWQMMGPGKGGAPKGRLADAINSTFGGFDRFKEQFAAAATTRFGSGWAWLVLDGSGKLQLYNRLNQDSPYMDGHKPVLGLDVWEHAYYLKYQNRRPEYITAWWNTVSWDHCGHLFEQAAK